jgi:hypothetical protein
VDAVERDDIERSGRITAGTDSIAPPEVKLVQLLEMMAAGLRAFT